MGMRSTQTWQEFEDDTDSGDEMARYAVMLEELRADDTATSTIGRHQGTGKAEGEEEKLLRMSAGQRVGKLACASLFMDTSDSGDDSEWETRG